MGNWKVTEGCELYFVTTTIVEWQYVFTSIPLFEILVEGLRHCIKYKGLHLHAFVIMLNHAHYIVSASPAKSLSGIMRDFGTHTSREITSELKRNGSKDLLDVFRKAALDDGGRSNRFKVWQEGFHPIAIYSENFFLEKLNYLHMNPVKKGYVEDPDHWKYSSSRSYSTGQKSVIDVECLV